MYNICGGYICKSVLAFIDIGTKLMSLINKMQPNIYKCGATFTNVGFFIYKNIYTNIQQHYKCDSTYII